MMYLIENSKYRCKLSLRAFLFAKKMFTRKKFLKLELRQYTNAVKF